MPRPGDGAARVSEKLRAICQKFIPFLRKRCDGFGTRPIEQGKKRIRSLL